MKRPTATRTKEARLEMKPAEVIYVVRTSAGNEEVHETAKSARDSASDFHTAMNLVATVHKYILAPKPARTKRGESEMKPAKRSSTKPRGISGAEMVATAAQSALDELARAKRKAKAI